MSPAGESMTALHSWVHNPKYIEKFGKTDGSELFVDYVVHVFVRLFWTIYDIYTECEVYHLDLSEENVLIRKNNGAPYPPLIDFDHARLCSDTGNDNVWSRTGTVSFMSMLNLAGYSNKHTIVDELESFLYLWVWKCTIGFTPPDISHTQSAPNTTQATSVEPSANPRVQPVSRLKLTNQNLAALARRSKHPVGAVKQPEVWNWAKGEPGDECLLAKFLNTSSNLIFGTVLNELRPEFRTLKPLFLKLSRILFDWDGEQSTFFSGTISGEKITVRQGRTRRGRSSS
ncbi:hypothetical protein IWQ61_009011, partial [Dispira simplex]